MKKDNQFKKRRRVRMERKYEFRNPNINSYLIVTEGECTEPLYFNGLKEQIDRKIGGRIDIMQKPQIKISGEGSGTSQLIKAAEKIIKNAKVIYQNVWIVLDKDDFQDFDKAIRDGMNKGYKMAWSNQAFEYWLYLHFAYSDVALNRKDWIKKLDDIFKKCNIGKNGYDKTYDKIYAAVITHGSIEKAINNAKKRMSQYVEGEVKPSEYNPGTMVYRLVEELVNYLKE